MSYFVDPSFELASKCLASALQSLFPAVSIQKAFGSPSGFCCTFDSPVIITPEQYPYIEQKIRDLIKVNEIQFFEMVKKSAIEFLHFHGRKRKAQQLKGWSEGLIELVKVGSFVDVLERPTKECSSLKFKIIFLQTLGPHHYALYALASLDEISLKAKIKAFKSLNQHGHLAKLEAQKYLDSVKPGLWVWTSLGHALFSRYEKGIETLFLNSGITPLISTKELSLEEIENYITSRGISKTYRKKVISTENIDEHNTGLFSISSNQGYEIFLQAKTPFELQGLLKEFFTPFYASASKVLQGTYEEFFEKSNLCQIQRWKEGDHATCGLAQKDLLQREWTLFECYVQKKKNLFTAAITFLSIERWIAFSLEAENASLATINFIF